MKIVKLNKRHNAHKELGHNWAFRWNSYTPGECAKVERIFQNLHGSQYSKTNIWKSGFGHATRGSVYRPYWISFVNETDITMVLLMMQE